MNVVRLADDFPERRQGNDVLAAKIDGMNIEIKQAGRRATEIVPTGRLDETTVHELRPVLLDSIYPSPKILLNLSRVEKIDAAGMALVMMARVELEANGTRFVVESSEPRLTRTLMAAGLPRFVTIAPRRLDALRALGEEAEPEAVLRDLGAGGIALADA
jgi:anti-anti-sigma factor